MATRSLAAQQILLSKADEHCADLRVMDSRVVEIKEQIVNIRQTSENSIAKQIELKDGLNADLSVLKENASSVQSSVMSLTHLGGRILQLYCPFSHVRSTPLTRTTSINSFPVEIRDMLKTLLYA